MTKLLGFIGMSVGGSIGWSVGAHFSLFAAFLLSVVGTGGGLYLGRRIAAGYF